MILYPDASALVELYAAEQHRELFEAAVRESDLVVATRPAKTRKAPPSPEKPQSPKKSA